MESLSFSLYDQNFGTFLVRLTRKSRQRQLEVDKFIHKIAKERHKVLRLKERERKSRYDLIGEGFGKTSLHSHKPTHVHAKIVV